ncbi:arf-GAP with SH3 domain, ANK repeat and PH domain-containing protein 2-like isoform X3 [Anneissia japonica]|uniref:arf-GAP with SH3 domain, ANK repeat and PH domain-containing protein 2-like isoform X3 n=1 Tax=Anneissia japonica TaxID=1529436 RepID=UPI0014254F7E|nr:arf-GAP with SH3 domain, ANK repeat and PH domain-containing protein 2-like isoform X3 [Anneissia japonica]
MITVADFITESQDDFNSPTTSTFVSRMGDCRNTLSMLEEALDTDRGCLTKMKRSIRSIQSSGNEHVTDMMTLSETLEKLGANAFSKEKEPELGTAFLKFSVIIKELAALMKNLVHNINNIIIFPLDALLKGDLKGQKGDLKKPFEKAWKEYESKFSKIEKEKKQQAKDAGLIRTEVTGAETAEEMEKERRMFQHCMCEYLIKVNEIKAKKGVELVQHLVEFFHAQSNFYQEGSKTVETFRNYMETLSSQVQKIKTEQDEEKRNLQSLRTLLKGSLTTSLGRDPQQGYALHQLETDVSHGTTKDGFLHKKAEKGMRLYQKRRCIVKDGYLSIAHSTSTKDPVKLNLLTCQVKPSKEEASKKYFDLVARDRTYHFMAETEEEATEWISVLNNSKKNALEVVFDGDTKKNSLQELTQNIVTEITKLNGNNTCCDCNSEDPKWLSTNLGILTCIECSGIHREMGVHISRVQSLELDRLTTAQLVIARNMGNATFNEVFEGSLQLDMKPTKASTMEVRKNFIQAKYIDHKYALKVSSSQSESMQDIKKAVTTSDMSLLLRVFTDGVDLASAITDQLKQKTALHLAVEKQGKRNLHIVDFIVQNSRNLDVKTRDGNTPLHLCAIQDKQESMKVILKGKGNITAVNDSGETALDLVKRFHFWECKELLEQAAEEKFSQCENVDIEWCLSTANGNDAVDFSDDELDDNRTPSRRRPNSVMPGAPISPRIHQRHSTERRERSGSDGTDGDAFVLTRPTHAPPIPPRRTAPVHKKKLTAPLAPNGHKRTTSDTFLNQVLPVPPVRGSSVAGKLEKDDSMPPPLAPKPSGISHGRPASLHGRPPIIPPRDFSKSAENLPQVTSKSVSRQGSVSEQEEIVRPTVAPPAIPTQATHRQSTLQRPSCPPPPSPQPQVTVDRPSPKMYLQSQKKRVKALYDCQADYDDELTFNDGEIIIVIGEADKEWWIGEIEGEPTRRGVFPVSFVSPPI